MTCDDGLVAAIYAALHYDADSPRECAALVRLPGTLFAPEGTALLHVELQAAGGAE